jgi:hypothetical protein
MSRTKRALWSFAIDGGAVGTILLRGASMPRFVHIERAGAILLEAVTFAAGARLDFGWQSDPAALSTAIWGSSLDPSTFGAPPVLLFEGSPGTTIQIVPRATLEPFVMVVSGAAVTGGAIELFVEAIEI